MNDILAPVPMDGLDVWLVALGFVVFAVVCNIVAMPREHVETQRTQGRFHPVAYGIVLLVVLLALGVV